VDVELAPIDLRKRSSLKKRRCRKDVSMRLDVQCVSGEGSQEKPAGRHPVKDHHHRLAHSPRSIGLMAGTVRRSIPLKNDAVEGFIGKDPGLGPVSK
jgi:hypothetical protein